MEGTMRLKGKFCGAGLIVVLVGMVLAGCKSSGQATPTAGESTGSAYTSKIFTTSYTGALDASSQMMLGMLKLEGTENAVTAEQANAMLRFMQALQGQVLKSDAERNAVWANIEAQLTPAQSSAVANMRLTQNDLQTWTQNNSQGAGAAPQGMPGGAGMQGTPPAGQGQGGPRPQGTPGARSGQGGPGQQGGSGAPPNAGGAGMGQNNVLLNSLIRLLMSKSGGAAPAPGGGPASAPTRP
jgi:hypothetical protein